MPKKVTINDLKKPDPLQVVFSRILNFLSKYRSKIYLVSVFVILIILIMGVWYLYRLNYEKSASNLYAGAMKAMPSLEKDTSVLNVYKDTISKYPKSRAALMAYYRMGNIYYERQEIDNAIQSYQEFLKRSSEDSDLKTLVYTGLGYCYESKKDFKNALISFEKAEELNEAKNFEGIINRNIARIYEELNKPEKALEYYKKALNKITDPSTQLLIKRKISTLG